MYLFIYMYMVEQMYRPRDYLVRLVYDGADVIKNARKKSTIENKRIKNNRKPGMKKKKHKTKKYEKPRKKIHVNEFLKRWIDRGYDRDVVEKSYPPVGVSSGPVIGRRRKRDRNRALKNDPKFDEKTRNHQLYTTCGKLISVVVMDIFCFRFCFFFL